MSKKPAIIIILVASFAVHFAYFGQPQETVFDEVHFGKFVSGYYTHEYYFDIHPPLGKLMIAGFAKLFNFQPEYSFTEIGQKFPDHKYLVLRFLPVLAGTFLPLIIFLLALELGFSPLAAFGAGMFITLDNALLAQSRYILLDMFLLDFGFLSLFFYFRYRGRQQLKYLASMAVFGALSASIKWTGLSFLGLAFLVEAYTIIRYKIFSPKKIASAIIFFAVVPFIIYFSIFAIHFNLLNKSGPGDAFMTPDFSSNNILKKFTELNIEMYQANQRLTAAHSYSSQWYTWPFMIRPIYYWTSPCRDCLGVQPMSQPTSRIYMLGNPLVWWASTLAILIFIQMLFTPLFSKKAEKVKELTGTSVILFSGYVLNMLPFIGVKRVLFLYHYFTALIFAILILFWLLDRPAAEIAGALSRRDGRTLTILGLIGLALISFLYFAPLTYGLKLTDDQYNQRLWLSSWR